MPNVELWTIQCECNWRKYDKIKLPLIGLSIGIRGCLLKAVGYHFFGILAYFLCEFVTLGVP